MNLPISQENALARPGVQPAERGPIPSQIKSGGEDPAYRRKPILWKIVPGNLADYANSADIRRGVEAKAMGWRFAISRFRFSWVELLGIVGAGRLILAGEIIGGLIVLVLFALLQALLISWPE